MGFDSSDDACIYKISDDVAIVQTVDFFPPMVDDPFIFGQIAAANALSDIYAMGGKVTHALNLLCFPSCLDISIAGEILAGGADKVLEAGAVVAGGHSIVDNEPKFGLCVSGLIDPKKVLPNSGARPGDKLIITKAMGTGILSTAQKGGILAESSYMAAIETMRQLNRRAAEIAQTFDMSGCTDITGFGLIGHACEMAEGSDTTIVLDSAAIPLLPDAFDMASMGIIPAGAYNNRDYFGSRVEVKDSVHLALSDIMYDPQTSGGLLLAVPEKDAAELLKALKGELPVAECIGEVIPKGEKSIVVI